MSERNMNRIENFGDERQAGFCPQCGQAPETRDHVPPKFFLDDPYPEEFPPVLACEKCNNGASLDEQFVACLIDCAIVGDAVPGPRHREKVNRTLVARPSLAAKVAIQGRRNLDGRTLIQIEGTRVDRVLLKMARGHALFELNDPHPYDPTSLWFRPLNEMTSATRANFISAPHQGQWPEVGSRAMQRLAERFPGGPEWVVVQEGRYRYLALAHPTPAVRIVLSEYLAVEARWHDRDGQASLIGGECEERSLAQRSAKFTPF